MSKVFDPLPSRSPVQSPGDRASQQRFPWPQAIASVLVLLLVLVLPARSASATPWSFIAIGDMPYSEAENISLKGEITQAIRNANPPFVVHYGDFKGGGEACTPELFVERRDTIYNLLPDRVFYTPGDNDWTDCDRDYLTPPVSELGKLDLMRNLFFSTPLMLPEAWAYSRQPNFPENARWFQNDVLFVTLHVVATNNGRVEVLEDDIQAALALVDARDEADRVWLDAAFQAAQSAKAKAVVIITQADLTAPDGNGACTAYNRINCDAFASLREQMIRRAGNFRDRGKPRKPVLLVHGDTNPYCWDKTFGGDFAPNLWRLNAWGDYQSPPDATQVTVQLDNITEPFAAQTLIHGIAPQSLCD